MIHAGARKMSQPSNSGKDAPDSITTVTFLGNTSFLPEPGCDTSSFVINNRYLFDTGWYGHYFLLRSGILASDLSCLFLSHVHMDHYGGLAAILYFRGRTRDIAPLQIVGPAERLEELLDRTWAYVWDNAKASDVKNVALFPLKGGEKHETTEFLVETLGSRHSVPGLIYRFSDKKSGAVVGYSGDTAYQPETACHFRGADLLIHEANSGTAPFSPSGGHSTGKDAGTTAKEAGVHRMALIHVKLAERRATLQAAREIFPNTFYPVAGQIVEVPNNDFL
jgi:ribonuclease Z